MAKQPGFIFYPGDYLRDTQCLCEEVQVAYDRLMCEHMRNICISQQQLNFFTKKLKPEQKNELMLVLESVDGGFQIPWVADSITKYNSYRLSRSENRKGKKKDVNNISKTYDSHMESESDNAIESSSLEVQETFLIPSLMRIFKERQPKYPDHRETDFPALGSISKKIMKSLSINQRDPAITTLVGSVWIKMCDWICGSEFYANKQLTIIDKQFQTVYMHTFNDAHNKLSSNGISKNTNAYANWGK